MAFARNTPPTRASPCRLTRWGAVVGAVISRAPVRTSVVYYFNARALSHICKIGQTCRIFIYCSCWHRAGPSSRRPEGRPPMTVTNPRQVGGSRAHDERDRLCPLPASVRYSTGPLRRKLKRLRGRHRRARGHGSLAVPNGTATSSGRCLALLIRALRVRLPLSIRLRANRRCQYRPK